MENVTHAHQCVPGPLPAFREGPGDEANTVAKVFADFSSGVFKLGGSGNAIPDN